MNRPDVLPSTRPMRLTTLAAPVLAVVLLAPTVAPAAQAAFAELEKRQTIEVVYVDDDEPRYVAEQIEAFAGDAGLPYQEQAVGSRSELLAAIRGSDADVLVVAGHGATRQAGLGSGIEVGDAVAYRSAVVDAIHASDAGRFFFAVCGLGLPDSVDGRNVEGYDGYVDMKVAAIGALSDVGFLYSRSTAEDLLPEFRAAIDRIASEEEIVARMIQPQDPLHDHDNQDGPSCYNGSHGGRNCTWSSESEDNGASRQRSESGAWPKLGGFFDLGKTMKLTWDNGEWAFRAEIEAPDCIEVYEVDGLSVPGYNFQDKINRLPGVKGDADAFELEVCGAVSLGIPADSEGGGEGEAAGEVLVKGGTELELKIQFGWAHIEIEAWIGLTAPITLSLTVEDHETDDNDGLEWRLEFEAALNFVAQAEWGYVDASIFIRLGSFEACWGTTCDQSQDDSPRGPSADGAPYVSGAEPRLQQASQTVTRANLQHLEDDPTLADRLSEAIDRDAAELAIGTRLNLRNADVCEVIYGDDPLCTYATPSADPLLGDAAGGPGPAAPTASGGDGGSDDENQCSGNNGSQCQEAESSEQRTYRETCAQVRNATNRTPGPKANCPAEELPVNSQRKCMKWTGSERVCHRLAMTVAFPDIVERRSYRAMIGYLVPDINEPDAANRTTVVESPCKQVDSSICSFESNLKIGDEPVLKHARTTAQAQENRTVSMLRAMGADDATIDETNAWTECMVEGPGCSD